MQIKNSDNLINANVLIRTYRIIQSKPLKIFLSSDFIGKSNSRKHLKVLVAMGLIEEVEAYISVHNSKRPKASRKVRGFRLVPTVFTTRKIKPPKDI